MTQAALEAYGAVRHERRLADRALDAALRAKRHLYSNERRAVAERVYSLLRQQVPVDRLLADLHLPVASESGGDVFRLATARVRDGEAPATVARDMALSSPQASALERIAAAEAAWTRLPDDERFALRASLPDFLARRVRAELGDQADAFADAMNQRAPLVARVNTLKTDRDQLLSRLAQQGMECHPTPLSPLGVVLDRRVNAFSLPAFKEGWFEIQDEGSQLLGLLVDAPPTLAVDACAGAGGKTLQLAAQMRNRGELHAWDIDAPRLDELRRRARRAGAHNVRVRVIAATGPLDPTLDALAGRVDRVLVDAPCTGAGTFRRKPDARYRIGPDDVAQFAVRQRALLERHSAWVKPGGRLVYGTCSIFREENESVVEGFLADHPEFTVRSAAELLGSDLGPRVTRDGFLRVAPHTHDTDGFFGAVLQRSR